MFEEKNTYNEEYYQKYKEKLKKRAALYREQNREKILLKKKEYYRKHHEECLERSRLYCQKNKDKIKRRDALYRERNREKLLLKNKEYYRKHKTEFNRKRREYNTKKKREALGLFGNKCFFCGYIQERNLLFHEKIGKNHRGRRSYMLALKQPECFVLVCYVCHKGIHFCMTHLGMSWEEIEGRKSLALTNQVCSVEIETEAGRWL